MNAGQSVIFFSDGLLRGANLAKQVINLPLNLGHPALPLALDVTPLFEQRLQPEDKLGHGRGLPVHRLD
jgi:hypothetical protein